MARTYIYTHTPHTRTHTHIFQRYDGEGVWLGPEAFWRHVEKGAHKGGALDHGAVELSGDTKVRDLDTAAVVHQQVAGLEVAVHLK